MICMNISIRPVDPVWRRQADAYIREQWAGPMVVTKGKLLDTSSLPGFAATDENGGFCGAAIYHISGSECEIAALFSLSENRGVGSALIRAVIGAAEKAGCRRVWLVTTNDNTKAIRFYQKFGFSLKAVHFDALQKSRLLKPFIPLTGEDGIPLLHEFEFEIMLESSSRSHKT